MAYKMITSIATFAGLASAAAFPRYTRSTGVCTNSTEFTLQIKVGQTWQSLNALGNCTSKTISLVAGPIDQFQGSPVIMGGNSSHASLTFDLTGQNTTLSDATGLWHLFIGDIGEVEGQYITVTAEQNLTYNGFQVYNGSVYNQLTAADQQFLACNTTIDGMPYTTLGWGNQYPNGSYPTGCETTLVQQSFNLQNCTAQPTPSPQKALSQDMSQALAKLASLNLLDTSGS